MAEGYEVIVKINLPPERQYHSGHSVIVQGHSVEEVVAQLDTIGGTPGNGKVILAAFGDYALQGATTRALGGDPAPEEKPAAKKRSFPRKAKPAKEKPPAGAGEDSPASDALKKVVAKKAGKTVEELDGISTAEAKALLKEAK